MKSNKDLTINEFLCSQYIKRAMVNLDSPKDVESFLKRALTELYR